MGLGRRVAAASAVLALVWAGAAACSGTDDDTVVAAPSALSDTAGDIRSGRIDVRIDGMRLHVEFEGGKARFTFEAPAEDASDGGVDAGGPRNRGTILIVDRHTYLVDGDRFMLVPEDAAAEFGVGAADAQEAGRYVDAVRAVLRETTVSDPGVRSDDGGVPVVRYHTRATGRAATDLLTAISGEALDPSAPDMSAPDMSEPDTTPSDPSVPEPSLPDGMRAGIDRMHRVMQYQMEHLTVDVTGDVDEQGHLRRVQVTMSEDSSEYPDCKVFGSGMGEMRMTATEINQPQHLEAPPSDRVDPYDRKRAQELSGVDASTGDGTDVGTGSDGSDGGAQTDVAPDAAAETVTTATGERTVAEVLDFLRRWAEGHGIDWRSMPLPDRPQMVAWFDQFYAQDLAERGPELTTGLGRYPRGYLVAVVTELSPDVDAASLDDAALVAAYEAARGDGDVPSTSSYGDTYVPPATSDDPGADSIPPDAADAAGDLDGLFEGCPA